MRIFGIVQNNREQENSDGKVNIVAMTVLCSDQRAAPARTQIIICTAADYTTEHRTHLLQTCKQRCNKELAARDERVDSVEFRPVKTALIWQEITKGMAECRP